MSASIAFAEQSYGTSRSSTSPREKVIWAVDTIPPIFYQEHGKLNGFGKDAIDWFINRIPDHDIAIEALPRGRAHEFMRHAQDKGGKTVCVPGMLETPERAKDFVFSKSFSPVLPVSVIIEADRYSDFAAYLNENGEVALPLLLANSGLFPGVEIGRSYGPLVDRALGDIENDQHIQGTRQIADFAQMLSLGRIDWFLAYPMEASHLFAQSTADTSIKSLRIAGMPDVLHGRFACSPTPTGHDMIAKINAEITAARSLP